MLGVAGRPSCSQVVEIRQLRAAEAVGRAVEDLGRGAAGADMHAAAADGQAQVLDEARQLDPPRGAGDGGFHHGLRKAVAPVGAAKGARRDEAAGEVLGAGADAGPREDVEGGADDRGAGGGVERSEPSPLGRRRHDCGRRGAG